MNYFVSEHIPGGSGEPNRPTEIEKNVKGQGESYQGLPVKVACKTYSYYVKRNRMRGNRR